MSRYTPFDDRWTSQDKGYTTPCHVFHMVSIRGYGLHSLPWNGTRSKTVLAHRFAWERANGPIKFGLAVCHRCDVPSCVNVTHLFVGTQTQNLADARAKGRMTFDWMRGARNYGCKLTDIQIHAIRAVEGYYGVQKDLAESFGVSQGHISDIRAGKKRVKVSIGA